MKAIVKKIVKENHWSFLSWYRSRFGFFPAISSYAHLLINNGIGRVPNTLTGRGIFVRPGTTDQNVFDDYLKTVRNSSDQGMNRSLKLFFQALFGLILAFLILSPGSTPFPSDITTKLYVPFVKDPIIDLSFFYYPFIILAIVGISNSINFVYQIFIYSDL